MITWLRLYFGFGPAEGAEVTERQKRRDRRIVYRLLSEHCDTGGPIEVVDLPELCEFLQLENRMSMSRFRSAIWHLRIGDRKDCQRKRIRVIKSRGEGDGIRGSFERTLRVAVV